MSWCWLIFAKPPLKAAETIKPRPTGKITPSDVIITDGTPHVLNCLRSVSSPAENIIRITPIFARKERPSSVASVKMV